MSGKSLVAIFNVTFLASIRAFSYEHCGDTSSSDKIVVLSAVRTTESGDDDREPLDPFQKQCCGGTPLLKKVFEPSVQIIKKK